MKKIKNYMIALYASAAIGLTDAGYFAYNVIKDKTITNKTANISGSGLIAYTALWGIGIIGAAKDNKLEEKLTN